MNWMWSWDETVSITIDTFRTMLNLMEEYPEFKFSQSQASVYHIIEEYAHDTLTEIRIEVFTTLASKSHRMNYKDC